MADLNSLSDDQLRQLYAINQLESGGAKDTSTVTSNKGAQGSMQVMPKTQGDPGYGVTPSNGTPADTTREGHDYYLTLADKYKDPTVAAIAYNMGPGATDKWLQAGGDYNKLPDETLKYAYNFQQKLNSTAAPSTPQPPAPGSNNIQNSTAIPDYSKMTDDQLKAEYAKQNPPDNNSIWNNIKGAGLQAANLAVAGIETPAILGAGVIGAGQRALEGQPLAANLSKTVENVQKNYGQFSAEQGLNKLGVDTSGVQQSAGYQLPNEAMNYIGNALPQQLAQAGTSTSPFAAAQVLSPQQQAVAKPALQLAELAAPLLHRGGGIAALGKEGAPGEALGKLAPDDAVAPSAAMPNAEEAFNEQPIPYRQYFEQPSLFDEATQGAQPEGPTLAGSTAAEAFPQEGARGSLSNRRQGELQLDNNEPISVNAEGEATTAQQAAEVTPFRDIMEKRIADLKNQSAEQLDMFNPIDQRTFDQFGPDETPRSLSPEEFADTVSNLAQKDGTRFPMPEDMEKAYGAYMDTVRDDQGGLFDRATIAKNFVEGVAKDAMDQRVADHPVVKAGMEKVAGLEAQIAQSQAAGRSTNLLERQRDEAQKTLAKAKDNIGKALGKDPRLPYEKDGVVNMFTFGNLPELFKSIGAVLKGLHGVVFKTLDRLMPGFKNLDSTAKIFGQGIKNFVNREANRDWSQTVNERPMDQFGKLPGGIRSAIDSLNPHAQDELSPQELKAQMQQAQDLSGSKVGNFLRNNLLQGGLMLSDFSQHPLVKYTTDSVAKAFRSSDKWARENLLNKATGLGPMIKAMDLDRFTEIRSLMEANEGIKEFSPHELKGRGFSDEQIKYYIRSLELQKEAFAKFNAGRVAAGLKPVDPRIAHIAGYFNGDFKQIVKDSAGRVVAVLAHNNRAALGVIAKRFQELHPDGENLDMGKPVLRKGSMEDSTFHGFMNILNEMSKTNADVSRLVQAYHDAQMAATNKLSQMANRGKFKTAPKNRVGGAEGQKLWQSMQQNAIDGGKQQLKYLDSVNRWSEFQQAISKSENFIKDPEINTPNAKSVSQAYLDNQMHRNLGDLNKFTNSFVNGIADITGVGPSQMRGMANFTKTGLLNMFVGLGKFSHSMVTLLQPFFGIPEVNSVLKARGAELGKAQVLSVFKSLMSNKDILQSLAIKQPIADPFIRAANQYAKDNDTFNTSQFSMGSVTHTPTRLGNALHINVTVPESGTRAFTYMYYAHMLKDVVGDTMSDKEIFGTAHNAVQKVMADYNREAQAPIYNKLGFLGDLTRMLTTFKMNQVSQAATASKLFSQGKVMPMVTMLVSSVAASGLRGFIGYNIANGLLGQITTWATKNGMMKQPTNLDQILLHMLHGVNHNLADALNFGATSGLGIDMTGSLSHADDIPDDPLGTLLPEGNPLAKVAGSLATVAEQPNKQNAKTALYDALPNSMKGIMENMAYTDEKGNYYDPHTGKLVDQRSSLDQAKRAASFRPLDESKMRLEARVGQEQNQQLDVVKSTIKQRMLSDSDSGSLTQQDMQNYAHRYFQAGGDPNELVSALVTHRGIDKNLNIEQREAGLGKNLTGAERYQRAQELK